MARYKIIFSNVCSQIFQWKMEQKETYQSWESCYFDGGVLVYFSSLHIFIVSNFLITTYYVYNGK